jgi:hypothetical protein
MRSARHSSRRLPPRALAVLAAAALLGLLALALTRGDGHSARADDHDVDTVQPRASSQLPATPVDVAVDARRPGRAVPPDFLGLSFEATSLGTMAEYAKRGDFAALLRSLGGGVIRFGGVSADTQVGWADSSAGRPAWASTAIVAGELEGLARLANETGWHVLLTLGLAHYEPAVAAREAAAAHAALGSALTALEIGNEPDAYSHHGLRGAAWGYGQYDTQVDGYRKAITRLTGPLPLAGPGVSGSHAYARWGSGEAAALRPRLLTGHHYPLGCHQQPQPSIGRLLSLHTRLAEQASLRRYMAVARARGIGFRLDEVGSVSCGGRAGISDTFASALWGVRYVTAAMSAGVEGINFEGNVGNCSGYSPLCASTPEQMAAGQLHAQPAWYALLLARSLTGDRPLRTRTAAGHTNVTVAAFARPGGGLHLVLVDGEPAGAPPARVTVHVGAGYGSARVLELMAPSLEATEGVTLGGQSLAANGSWTEPPLPTDPVQGGVVAVTLSPASASLVTVAG